MGGPYRPPRWENIRNRAGFDLNRIKRSKLETRHDVIAFLTNVAEHVGGIQVHSHGTYLI